VTKREIKDKLLDAIKRDEHFSDIRSVSLFGSCVTGETAEGSDVDVLVQFAQDACIGLFEYVRIQRRLAAALGVDVDLVTPEALSRYIKDKVLAQAELVYER
jgi:predicted nucleotidyltransferase